MFLRHEIDVFSPTAVSLPICLTKDEQLIATLMANAELSIENARSARGMAGTQAADLGDILVANHFCTKAAVLDALAQIWDVPFVSHTELQVDPDLLSKIGVAFCLKNRFFPKLHTNGDVALVMAKPSDFHSVSEIVCKKIGPVSLIVASETDIVDVLLKNQSDALARQATITVKAADSCRDFKIYDPTKTASFGIFAIMGAILVAPTLLFTVLFCLASFTLLMNTAFKLWVTAAFLRMRQIGPVIEDPATETAKDERLPIVSVLVPLFDETEIATRLISRLEMIKYPAALLDIILLVEAADTATYAALMQVDLPQNMRIISVPDGPIRTKPRAMNYALPLCKGSIIGIYDAEDAPESDQILKVVARFQARSNKVACVQARLDFYNTSRNWLSRCFTVEYATWFRVILPGLQSLGMPIPLGGTSVFFRREILEKVGAWDAHNVTEDADLGMRLARNGYKTELISSTTYEEANCSVWPWIKQRSRWLKGYGLTYIVMMRRPRQLVQQVGFGNFCGLQVLFLGTLSGFILAPVLLSFWFLTFAVPHPSAEMLPQPML